MSKKEKPLPKPPSSPFGRKKSFEDPGSSEPLLADRMAMAMSEGTLDEFLQEEIPDSEYARKLAEMMMGFTGMMPPEAAPSAPEAREKKAPDRRSNKRGRGKPGKASPDVDPPEEVVKAVQSADVEGLMDLLKKEHNKRQGIKEEKPAKPQKKSSPPKNSAAIEKEILDQLIKIASENNLPLDWIVLRALTRYVQEYKKTGSL